MEVYDPETGTWAQAGAVSEYRSDFTATLLPTGKVLVSGGFDRGVLVTHAEVHDPAAGTWAPTGAMSWPRFQHTATLRHGPARQMLEAWLAMSGPHEPFARSTFGHPGRAAAESRTVLPAHLVSAVACSSLRREPGPQRDEAQ